MILGHSFVRRLHKDLHDNFEDRAKRVFDLQEAYVRLFGVGGRTVPKLLQYDLNNVVLFSADIVILEIGTNDLTTEPPEIVNDFSVSVIVVCAVIPRANANENFNEKAKLLNQY